MQLPTVRAIARMEGSAKCEIRSLRDVRSGRVSQEIPGFVFLTSRNADARTQRSECASAAHGRQARGFKLEVCRFLGVVVAAEHDEVVEKGREG